MLRVFPFLVTNRHPALLSGSAADLIGRALLRFGLDLLHDALANDIDHKVEVAVAAPGRVCVARRRGNFLRCREVGGGGRGDR